jgi:hypothetical protein
MSSHRHEDLKPWANRLSTLLGDANGARLLNLSQQLAQLQAEEKTGAPEPARPGKGGKSVGIWVRKDDGSFACAPRFSDERYLWADIDTIPAKSAKRRRVAFLGESVARGFFYDPVFNCAIALQSIFERTKGLEDVVVIDRGKSNQTAPELEELVGTLSLLQPDAVVVFAGNNWHRSIPFCPPKSKSFVEDVAALRAGDFSTFLQRQTERLRVLGRRVCTTLDAFASERKIPVVVLIPEYNLEFTHEFDLPMCVDWESTKRWMQLKREVQKLIDEKQFERAGALAKEMVQLDGGVSSGSAQLLARCQLASGDVAAARASFERARGVSLLDPLARMTRAPGIHAVTQDELRKFDSPRLNRIDLPAVFRDHLGGGLPDRKLLMDYCHLTAEGIKITMAAVAERLAPLMAGPQESIRTLAERVEMPGADVEALALLGAALHNANCRQPYEVVRHYYDAALQASPIAASAVVHFGKMLASQTGGVLNDSFYKLIAAHRQKAQRLLGYASARYTPNQTPVNGATAFVAMIDALKERSAEEANGLLELATAEFGLADDEPLNLLEPWHWTVGLWNRPLGMLRAGELAHLRTYAPEQRFLFLSDRPKSAVLKIACRVPGALEQGDATITFNGKVIGTVRVGPEWVAQEIEVAAATMSRGTNRMNELVVQWPLLGRKAGRLQEAVDNVELGGIPDIFTSFGEVSTLTVTVRTSA